MKKRVLSGPVMKTEEDLKWKGKKCSTDGGELGGEGRRGSSSSILFLFIKLLHQEINANKRIFSVYVHAMKVRHLFIDF